MPTSRPRHQVTETADIARALDLAALRWPGEPRGRLLLRLIAAGEQQLTEVVEAARRDREHAVHALKGSWSDVFDADYLTRLRDDWPP